MARRCVSLLCLLWSLAVGYCLPSSKHSPVTLPREDAAGSVQLQLHLQYQNVDQLDGLLAAVSTPGSPRYGQYFTQAEVTAIFGPPQTSQQNVLDWLSRIGAQNILNDGTIIIFDLASSLVASLFTSITTSRHPRALASGLEDGLYDVPAEISPFVSVVSASSERSTTRTRARYPGHPRSSPEAELTNRQAPSPSCETTAINVLGSNETIPAFSPACLKELYGLTNYKADPNSESTIAFANFVNETANYLDLAQFEALFNIPSQNYSIAGLINGAVNDQDPATEIDPEGNLDVQTLISISDGLPISAYLTGGVAPFIPDLISPTASSNEPYLEFYTYLLSQPDSTLPYIISQSYFDHENTVPAAYAQHVCTQIGLLGLRGRTILAASGDEGVGALCQSNLPPRNPQFSPAFPSTCPYITSVGGTQLSNPDSPSLSSPDQQEEAAWYGSGGGFSFLFPQPTYQSSAVSAYLSTHLDPSLRASWSDAGYVNFSGRAFPDLSAHADFPQVAFVWQGEVVGGRGTSVSTPVVAGVLGLVNDARLRAGMPVLGFVNPFLYGVGWEGGDGRTGGVLRDVVVGGSLGCNGTDLQNGVEVPGATVIEGVGWNATVGWDPATGLGTPGWEMLLEAALEVGRGKGWSGGGSVHGWE